MQNPPKLVPGEAPCGKNIPEALVSCQCDAGNTASNSSQSSTKMKSDLKKSEDTSSAQDKKGSGNTKNAKKKMAFECEPHLKEKIDKQDGIKGCKPVIREPIFIDLRSRYERILCL